MPDNIYQTKWKQTDPFTVFHDDDLIFETLDGKACYIMRYMEFEWLAQKLLHTCWEENKCKYVQIVKEWNECVGFNDVKEIPSIIADIDDTINALKTLQYEPVVTDYYGVMDETDAKALIHFFTIHKATGIKIYRG